MRNSASFQFWSPIEPLCSQLHRDSASFRKLSVYQRAAAANPTSSSRGGCKRPTEYEFRLCSLNGFHAEDRTSSDSAHLNDAAIPVQLYARQYCPKLS